MEAKSYMLSDQATSNAVLIRAAYGDDPSYYAYVRQEIEPLLPAEYTRVLEVGCGSGNTLRWLRDRSPHSRTIGIELNTSVAGELSLNASEVHIADASSPPEDLSPCDLVLFLDVLEHFANPRAVVLNYMPILSPGGVMIISLPNIANYSVSLPLLFCRRFEYSEAGILDQTHLQFFTAESAVALLNRCGMIVTAGLVNGPNRGKAQVFDRLTFGLFRHYLTRQYVMRAELAEGRDQPKLKWRCY